MKYKAAFRGRMKDAIGIRYDIVAEVEAADMDEAIIKLYDNFEHIGGLRLTEIEEE